MCFSMFLMNFHRFQYLCQFHMACTLYFGHETCHMWTFSFDELNYQATKLMLIFASSTSFITFCNERVSMITSACLLYVFEV